MGVGMTCPTLSTMNDEEEAEPTARNCSNASAQLLAAGKNQVRTQNGGHTRKHHIINVQGIVIFIFSSLFSPSHQDQIHSPGRQGGQQEEDFWHLTNTQPRSSQRKKESNQTYVGQL